MKCLLIIAVAAIAILPARAFAQEKKCFVRMPDGHAVEVPCPKPAEPKDDR